MRIKLLLASLLFLSACNNESDKQPTEDSLAAEDTVSSGPPVLQWVSDFDTVKNEFYLRQQRKANPDSLTAESIIKDLNASWDSVKLVLLKRSNDTLYVAIPQSEYLGQQMGSAGAQAYMASTTYNLTELKGIRFVNYQMQAGDHAGPGTFSRKSFENYR